MADDENRNDVGDVFANLAGAGVAIAAISNAPAIVGGLGGLFLHHPLPGISEVSAKLQQSWWPVRKIHEFRNMHLSVQLGAVAVSALLGIGAAYAVKQMQTDDGVPDAPARTR